MTPDSENASNDVTIFVLKDGKNQGSVQMRIKTKRRKFERSLK